MHIVDFWNLLPFSYSFGILPGYCHFITRHTEPCEVPLCPVTVAWGIPSPWQQPSVDWCATIKTWWCCPLTLVLWWLQQPLCHWTCSGVWEGKMFSRVLLWLYRPFCHTALSVSHIYHPPTTWGLSKCQGIFWVRWESWHLSLGF